MPFIALYHTHKLVVILFILIYFTKAIMLLIGNREALEKFKRKIKIPEAVISALFFITGLIMLKNIAVFNMIFAIKLILVVLAIPLAVVAYKKEQKLLGVLAVVVLLGAYGLAEFYKASFAKKHTIENVVTNPGEPGYDILAHGKALYQAQCSVCHGDDGRAGRSGAKDLSVSTKTDKEITSLIKTGKNTMPPMDKLFDEAELNALTAYVKSLRQQ